jgi:hypothetical protein
MKVEAVHSFKMLVDFTRPHSFTSHKVMLVILMCLCSYFSPMKRTLDASLCVFIPMCLGHFDPVFAAVSHQ